MELSKCIKDYIIELTDGDALYNKNELQIEKLCKKLNLGCFSAEFEDDISGAIAKDADSESYSIYVNRKHPRNRRRFTLAHEIGHYISFKKGSYSKSELEKNGELEDYAISYRKDGVSSDAETEANLIAAELLMPQRMLENLMKEKLTPEEMAERFFVSPSAMTIRLKDLYPNLMVI